MAVIGKVNGACCTAAFDSAPLFTYIAPCQIASSKADPARGFTQEGSADFPSSRRKLQGGLVKGPFVCGFFGVLTPASP
jgi:hypothetical protein